MKKDTSKHVELCSVIFLHFSAVALDMSIARCCTCPTKIQKTRRCVRRRNHSIKKTKDASNRIEFCQSVRGATGPKKKDLNMFRWATSVFHSSCRCFGALFGSPSTSRQEKSGHVSTSTPLRGCVSQKLGRCAADAPLPSLSDHCASVSPLSAMARVIPSEDVQLGWKNFLPAACYSSRSCQ